LAPRSRENLISRRSTPAAIRLGRRDVPKLLMLLAPRAGFEQATNRLTETPNTI
jgi:hypothetical protein